MNKKILLIVTFIVLFLASCGSGGDTSSVNIADSTTLQSEIYENRVAIAMPDLTGASNSPTDELE